MPRKPWLIPSEVRNMGVHICAGKGSGKSRLMGRCIAWHDFSCGLPVVIFDPYGQTIDNFLDKIRRLPTEHQPRGWRRVRYVDLSGSFGRIECFPLLYRAGNESLYKVASRYLELLAKSDTALMSAPMMGLNALLKIGRRAGVLLAAMGWQLSEAEALLNNPQAFAGRIHEAVARCPEARASAEYFFTEFPAPGSGAWRDLTTSYLRKLDLFLDALQKATYGASAPTIRWQEVIDHRQAVLLDFRGVSGEQKRFAILWLLTYLLDWVRTERGATRGRPVSLLIDELTFILNDAKLKDDPLTKDLEELINLLGRNGNIWLTLCHQEMYQLNDSVRKALLTMGVQMFGVTMDADSAKELAARFYPYRPDYVKKTTATYGGRGVTNIRTTEFTIQEQLELASRNFLNLGRYRFLVGVPESEGTMAKKLKKISIERVDAGQYPDKAVITEVRRRLAQRDGRRIADVLAGIEARRAGHDASGPTPAAPLVTQPDTPATPKRRARVAPL